MASPTTEGETQMPKIEVLENPDKTEESTTIEITPLRHMFPDNKAEMELLVLQRRRRIQIGVLAKTESRIALLIQEARSMVTEIAHCENVGDWHTREKIMEKTMLSSKRLAKAIEKADEQGKKLEETHRLYREAADFFRGTLTPVQREDVFEGLPKK